MISKIYDVNQILFQTVTRKGKSKKDIQKLVDKGKIKNKKPKKLKQPKIVKTKQIPTLKEQFEMKREKARLQSLARNPHLEMVDGKLVPKK